jgi:hypothetical protein
VEEMHAAAVARREGGGKTTRTAAEKELAAAKREGNAATREFTRHSEAEKAARTMVDETHSATFQARYAHSATLAHVREQLHAEALSHLAQTAPKRAERIAQLREKATALRAQANEAKLALAPHQAIAERIRQESAARGILVNRHPDTAAAERASRNARRAADQAESRAYSAEHAVKDAESHATAMQVERALRDHPEVRASLERVAQSDQAHSRAEVAHEQAREEMRRALTRVSASNARIASAERAVRAERSPHGISIVRQNQGQESIDAVFGRHMSEEDIIRLAGATRGAEIHVSGTNGHANVEISMNGEDRTARFFVRREGNEVVHYGSFVRNLGEKTSSSGAEVIKAFDNLKRSGVTRLEAQAAKEVHGGRERQMNGYYTWARLGATGEIPEHIVGDAQARFGSHVTRVEHLMAQQGGAGWWKQHGDSFDATFDFHDGSHSMSKLNEYGAMINRHGQDQTAGGSSV